MEKSLCKPVSRRTFLRGLLSLAVWPFVSGFGSIAEEVHVDARSNNGGTIETEDQAWGFPLSFPAYFPPGEKEEHKAYLPIITKGGSR